MSGNEKSEISPELRLKLYERFYVDRKTPEMKTYQRLVIDCEDAADRARASGRPKGADAGLFEVGYLWWDAQLWIAERLDDAPLSVRRLFGPYLAAVWRHAAREMGAYPSEMPGWDATDNWVLPSEKGAIESDVNVNDHDRLHIMNPSALLRAIPSYVKKDGIDGSA